MPEMEARVVEEGAGLGGRKKVGMQFQYHGEWGIIHGAFKDVFSPPPAVILSASEHIARVAGETINFQTSAQQVAKLELTVVDRKNITSTVHAFGNIPVGVPSVPWSLNYPLGEDPLMSCPMMYSCGSKTHGMVQQITIHWHECLHSNNVAKKLFDAYRVEAKKILDKKGDGVPYWGYK